MKRILVVDSDPRVCQAIHKTLSVMPHVVFFAFDAITAVSEARKHNPDLVIVDLSLPAGSGLLVVERLRALVWLGTWASRATLRCSYYSETKRPVS